VMSKFKRLSLRRVLFWCEEEEEAEMGLKKCLNT